jgi:hypothetical protein
MQINTNLPRKIKKRTVKVFVDNALRFQYLKSHEIISRLGHESRLYKVEW